MPRSLPFRTLAGALLASTALVGPALAQSLPTGGRVVSGGVTIGTPANGALAITQSSRNAIVNWQGFSIGRDNRVDIAQPNSQSAILNRVTGATPSTIAGQLNANGQVYLVNPNGITIARTGKVNAAGFVASTLDASDEDFRAGRRQFRGSGASAKVANAGTITIGRGGYAALIGGEVSNRGTISVPLGRVGLGSGERATLDLSGDGFLQVAAPTNGSGRKALVRSSGTISANGGSVILTAAAARDMARLAVNLSGTIEARSVSGRDGSIVLSGGDGAVAVSGTLTATSRRGAGGSVTATGRDLRLTGATVDVSGRSGGGSVRIGGGRQGRGPLTHAANTRIDAATTIRADARQTGNGGDVVVWSDVATQFAGTISAKGGAQGGNGGQAEVSSKGVLGYDGLAILTAAKGSFGTLLLDPYNITISNGAQTTGGGFTAGAPDSVINATTLSTQLASADVVVSTGSAGSAGAQAGNITVAAPLSWSSVSRLTLGAANAISIDAAITITGGGQLALFTGTTTVGATTQPLLSFGNGASVTFAAGQSGQALAINGQSYTLLRGMGDLPGLNGTTGHHALAGDFDASGTTYTGAVIDNFAGTLEGLGHTITGLTIDAPNTASIGLLRTNAGTVRDIGLVDANITGLGTDRIGALVGQNETGGAITQAYVTGAVSGYSRVGGLAGSNYGAITQSYATGVASGSNDRAAGLVGQNYGAITSSFATASVSGNGGVGGLVATNETGATITASYATGAVTGHGDNVGGLASNNSGTITGSYATGSVRNDATYASTGGLVGDSNGTITQSYATGSVSGGSEVGGLVGNHSGTISRSTASGSVSGTFEVGGLVGVNSGTVTQSYWDTQTTGQGSSSGGGTGYTTRQLQGLDALPGGGTITDASRLGSAFAGGTGGLYPYLTSFFPNGVQAVSGLAYKDSGAKLAASGAAGAVTVSLDANGGLIGQATTGANGYYYIAVANSTLANGTSLLVSTPANSATGATDSATLATSAGATTLPGINLYGNALTAATASLTLSGAPSLATLRTTATTTAGADSAAAGVVTAAAGAGYLATGASFSIDTPTPVTLGSSLLVRTLTGAPLTVDAAVTVADTGSLGLLSGGALRINAPVTAQGAAAVSLAYDSSDVTNLSFATGAPLTYVAADGGALASSANGTLSVNGNPYTLVYTMAGLAGLDGQYGAYALARDLDASSTSYTAAVVPSFSGTLEGLGHTVANLTITGLSFNAGLIGINNGGTVRDIRTVSGSVSGSDGVGGLVGVNSGTIVQATATGSVSGDTVGGLVGINYGTITQSTAAGSVSGSNFVGGLVGFNSGGTISQSAASGSVSGTNIVGGLVGDNQGTITQSIATGSVSGNQYVGGLVGFDNGGTITNSYWDTQTSGQATSDGGGAGLTTAQFQGTAALANGVTFALGAAFSGGAAGGTGGLYPYLTSFAPNGVQAFFGTAYSDAGATPLASGANGAIVVNLRSDATALGGATTGANGYYYLAVPLTAPFTPVVLTGANLLATTNSSAIPAARLATASGGQIQPGLNLYGGALTVETGATLFSRAPGSADEVRSTASHAQTLSTASGGDMNALRAITGATGLGLVATNPAGFTIDRTPAITGAFAVETCACAPLTVAAPITVASGQSLGLLSGGTLRITAPITAQGAAGVVLGYDAGDPTNLSFAQGAPLTYVASNGAALTSGAGGTLSVNGSPYTLVYTMAQVDAIDGTEAVGGTAVAQHGSGLTGAYALARNLDATETTYTQALIGSNFPGFLGALEGLGHTITGTTIDAAGNYIGLVAVNGGTLRDITLLGGRITAGANANEVGALAGENNGAIVDAYGTGSVSAGTNSQNVGGLVGYSAGTITQAYATGAVSGATKVGGLVGYNGGTITQAYATGSVSGTTAVGGLVGRALGTITQSFATGSVSGTTTVGGLVGYNGGTITSSYRDSQTTGQINSIGDGAAAGDLRLTTAQFQSGNLPTGFDSTVWATGAGLYPYLKSVYPTGAQAVSGIAYKSAGTTLAASGAAGAVTVSLASGGAVVGSATTGANGYYYILLPNGALGSGAGIVASTAANGSLSSAAASFARSSGTAVAASGLDLSGGWLREAAGGLTTLSGLDAAYAAAVGATPASALTLANREITAAGAFALDASVTQSGTLSLAAPGTVTQTAGTVTAGGLLVSGGSLSLTMAGNAVGTVAGSGASLALATSGNLSTGTLAGATGATIAGVATTGAVSLSAAGALTLASGAGISGADPALSAGSAFVNQAGSAGVTATSGRWLVYSATPAGDTFGGLDSADTAVWNKAAGAAVTQTGNRYVFASHPTLTVTSTDRTKTYGDAAASVAGAYTITGFDPGVAGAYLGDTAATALTGGPSVTSTGSAATAGVAGSPYTITAAAGTLAATSGYGLTFASPARLTVAARALTVTADAQSRVYGAADPALTYTLGGLGLVNGDTLSGGLATAATTASSVGRYAIGQGSLAASTNYALSYSGADLAVTPRGLTVTADAQSRVYGAANPALTYTLGGLGLINGDTLSGGLATAATTASSVGRYAIGQGSLAASANYAVSYTGADLAVTPRGLTVTADAQNRVYGAADPALTYTLGGLGLVNGDTLSGGLATVATTASSVGRYAIGQGSLAASANYAVSYSGADLAVTPRGLTVTADAQSRVYGAADPALTYTLGGLGLVNGDTLSGGLATAATTASSVGRYAIGQGSLAASTNYALSYSGADLAVTPRGLTVTADAQSRVYGAANPALTYTLGGLGLINGDTLSGGLATAATTASSVGRYAIGQGSLAASANYAVSYTGADLAVTPRGLTVTADAQNRVYGAADPALTYTLGGLGLVNGDTLSGGLATVATTASSVGRYAIGQGSLAASANYAVSYSGADLAVTPRGLTVTADAQSRVYGAADPALTYTLGGLGLVNGDVLSGGLATIADSTSPATAYPITQGTLSASANYTLAYQGAVLTVTGAPAPEMPAPLIPIIDATRLASTVARSLDAAGILPSRPDVLPDGADELPIASNYAARFVGLTDPRFQSIVVCMGGAAGACFPAPVTVSAPKPQATR